MTILDEKGYVALTVTFHGIHAAAELKILYNTKITKLPEAKTKENYLIEF